jgi:hypothetical protein
MAVNYNGISVTNVVKHNLNKVATNYCSIINLEKVGLKLLR